VKGVVQLADGRYKGLQHFLLFNIKTGKSRYAGIVYRKKANDKGIMLNFCPWCGAEIQFWKEK
jgi:hypothetical protein